MNRTENPLSTVLAPRARVAGERATSIARGGALAAIVANVVVLAVLLWSTTERLHVTVIASQGTVTGIVGTTTVQSIAPTSQTGEVGFFLQGADPKAAIQWSTTPLASTAAPTLSDLLYRLGAESAWTNVTVTSLTADQLLYPAPPGGPVELFRPQFGDWFAHPLGGLASSTPGLSLVGSTAWRQYQVDADLLRPRNAAGVLVLGGDGANGMLLYFRPENRDIMWYEVRDGQWYGPVATARYRAFALDPVASVQDVLRLVLGGYPAALLVLALVAGVGTLETLARRRTKPVAGTRSVDSQHTRGPASTLPPLAATLVVIAGLAATLYIADTVLERMPHVQDSVAYLFQAETFALGRLWVPTPPHPEFFAHEFIIMEPAGRWFGKYPPGWPLLLALGVLARAPWVVNPICGSLSLLLLYRIGREMYRPRVGLLAATLGLSAPFLLFLSGSMMSHASGLLFALLLTWSFWRASRSARPVLPAVIAGGAFGMLFLIRPYSALLVVIPFALYGMVTVSRGPTDALRRYAPAVAAAIPFVAMFLAYNKIFTGDWLYPPQQLWWPFDTVGLGPTHGPWGYTPIDALNNTSRNLSELLEHGFGWPQFLTLALAMVPFIARRARTWDWLLLLGFLAIVAGYGLWWADGIMYGPRFYFEGFGFLVLLTARGVDVALDLGRRGLGEPTAIRWRVPSIVAPVLVYSFVAALLAFNLWFYLPGQWQLYHGYNYVNRSKIDAVEASGIHHALVFADVGDQYAWWEYGMVFSANDPLLKDDVVYARDLGDAEDQTLLAYFPGRTYYRLQGTTLTAFDPAADSRAGRPTDNVGLLSSLHGSQPSPTMHPGT